MVSFLMKYFIYSIKYSVVEFKPKKEYQGKAGL